MTPRALGVQDPCSSRSSLTSAAFARVYPTDGWYIAYAGGRGPWGFKPGELAKLIERVLADA